MYDNKHIPWDISEDRRREYALSSKESQAARKRADALAQKSPESALSVRYDPNLAMPQKKKNGLKVLSLFSGGGGLDLGFDRAGFGHYASYEVLPFAGATLKANRKKWKVHSGSDGDVRRADWKHLNGKIDVVHGGPPCQPFSIAGRREGKADDRDMFPEFIRAIEEIRPRAFLAENVLGFMSKKFESYREEVLQKLGEHYNVVVFSLSSADFGVPQVRKRVFIVGSRKSEGRKFDQSKIAKPKKKWSAREALGLRKTDIDGPAPTLRCTLTGPRQTTSIANSTASVVKWTELGIWPHGVSPDRSVADAFPTKNQTYRLCVEECQVLQGFPLNWEFQGATYQRLGLIGNSVCPPVAYAVANAIHDQLLKD
ncbi:DNA (cytosine-5-)-methyltransferase [Ruegeria conchae]|uniref:DNA cytosine methyltransferase n=1 Tax=Ruegeria conchae TaxID=981384 RepID=UPI0021A43947|nr:DNA (cytosine-5-)-methyltransferase [Ruegeria conchae]UWR03766.1 DNA (cytosine-5-)-methyltransferase [Ruegeria conchae]